MICKYLTAFLFCLLLVSIPGCSGRSPSTRVSLPGHKRVESEADNPSVTNAIRYGRSALRVPDIPVPLSAQIVSVHEHSGTSEYLLEYCVQQPLDNLELFYQREMERSGWKLLIRTAWHEAGYSVLVFEKPLSRLVITMKASHTGTRLIITMIPRDTESSPVRENPLVSTFS